jgi:hypothetical protein
MGKTQKRCKQLDLQLTFAEIFSNAILVCIVTINDFFMPKRPALHYSFTSSKMGKNSTAVFIQKS